MSEQCKNCEGKGIVTYGVFACFGSQECHICKGSGKDPHKRIEALEAENEILDKYKQQWERQEATIQRVRDDFAMFWMAQGCSCCEDTEASDKYGRRLAELLDIPLFDDGSGVDYFSVCKALENSE